VMLTLLSFRMNLMVSIIFGLLHAAACGSLKRWMRIFGPR
jgi:hypothetical protein